MASNALQTVGSYPVQSTNYVTGTPGAVGTSRDLLNSGKNRQMLETEVWLTVEETTNLTGHTIQAVQKACKEGRLTVTMTTGRGGQQYRVRLDSLPETARLRYWLERLGAPIPQDEAAPSAQADPVLAPRAKAIALLRADLVRLYLRETEDREGGSLTARKDLFARRYNLGEWPDLYRELGKASRQTLERWKKTLRDANGDPMALAPAYRPAKGLQARKVTAQQAECILRYLLMGNGLKISEVIRQARKEWADLGLSQDIDDQTVRRWIDDWKRENRDTYEYMVKGRKAWNDRVAPYILRNKEQVELGDLLVADGHVLNFEILNPETGRPKRMTLLMVYDFRSNFPLGWEIMPVENVQSIASAYRRAILRLGFRPAAFYLDNGRAFRAKFFAGTADFNQSGVDGLFERLGAQVIHAWPYHGQSKTIERFFGTFAELERLQPSYVGTSIEHRPAHLRRGESLARTLRQNLTASTTPTIIEAHQLIADWCEEYVRRPQPTALHGLTPLQVAELSLDRVKAREGFETRRITEPELRLLMMEQEVRTLYRNGIKFNGEYYWHETFSTLEKGAGAVQLRVLYDWQDLSRLIVQTDDGQALIAERLTAQHPAARHLGTPDDVLALEQAINHRRALEAGVKQTVQQMAGALYPTSEAELPPPARTVEEKRPADVIDWKLIMPPEEEHHTPSLALFECERRNEV